MTTPMKSAFKRVMTAATLIVAVIAVSALPVLGAGKGNANGKNKSEPVSATLVADCNPCSADVPIRFSGSGYDASQGKALLDMAGVFTATAVHADGTISFDWALFDEAGTYVVNVFQKRNKKHSELKASLTVEVLASS